MAEKTQTGDRTEAATPRRIEKAREAGQIPISREVAAFASLAGATAIFALYEPNEIARWVRRLAAFIGQVGSINASPSELMRGGALNLLEPIWLPLLAACVCGAGAVLLQTRGFLRPEWAQPKFERVSPMAGLKRIFGVTGLTELAKSLSKLLAFVAVAYVLVRHDLYDLSILPFIALRAQWSMLGRALLHLLYSALLIQALTAGIDLGLVIFRHIRSLRMSKQDIRDEFKETEGNPHTKARIRRIRALRARRRMMSRVPKATVVITNPTHYAVALAYDRTANAAPQVVAKGIDGLALRIREVAAAAGVPIVPNPPLARTLYKLELEAEIPAEHFRVVAEIIAYVWRLKRMLTVVR